MSKRNLALALTSLVLIGTGCSGEASPNPGGPLGTAGAPVTNGGSTGASGSAPVTAGAAGSPIVSGGSSGSGTAGAAGSAAGSGGTSGAGTAGSTGTAGASATAGAGGMTMVTPPPVGPSLGCSKTPPAGDSANAFTKHDLMVTEPLSMAALAADPANGGTYDWTHRNYFLRLPANYDPTKQYRLEIGGSGCGGSDTVGSEGGYALQDAKQTGNIQIALSYLASSKGGACFADKFVDPPDLEYFDAVLAEVESRYCIDKANVYVHGYSSGAWLTYMLGCARAGIVRGIATSQGGSRNTRPACTGPIAAILSAGSAADNDNPIGPLDPNSATAKSLDSLGSAAARDDILKRNGCTDLTATKPWDPTYPTCVQYTSCPAAYPVVWCPINGGHEYAPAPLGGGGFEKFLSTLPPRP